MAWLEFQMKSEIMKRGHQMISDDEIYYDAAYLVYLEYNQALDIALRYKFSRIVSQYTVSSYIHTRQFR